MPKSLRHHYNARLAGKAAGPIAREYEVTDPLAKPDVKGHFAGAPAQRLGGKLVVRLTDKQAKFYLTQGTIRPRAN